MSFGQKINAAVRLLEAEKKLPPGLRAAPCCRSPKSLTSHRSAPRRSGLVFGFIDLAGRGILNCRAQQRLHATRAHARPSARRSCY